MYLGVIKKVFSLASSSSVKSSNQGRLSNTGLLTV